MILRIKKLDSRAVLPSYATPESAGADLYALTDADGISVPPHGVCVVHTGIAAVIPCGYAGLVYARSGLALRAGLAPANKVGVIDSDYRGEIIVALYNHSDRTAHISHGDRIAQLVITPVLTPEIEECERLPETERGTGGFGSSGR